MERRKNQDSKAHDQEDEKDEEADVAQSTNKLTQDSQKTTLAQQQVLGLGNELLMKTLTSDKARRRLRKKMEKEAQEEAEMKEKMRKLAEEKEQEKLRKEREVKEERERVKRE